MKTCTYEILGGPRVVDRWRTWLLRWAIRRLVRHLERRGMWGVQARSIAHMAAFNAVMEPKEK